MHVTTTDRVAAQLAELGVRHGDVLLVHTAFSRVQPVEGGPLGLIEALTRSVGETGTLVMPSWPDAVDGLFDPGRHPTDLDLGIVASEFWQQPGVERSDHAQAFAARGPQASRILADPLPLPPHGPASPVGRVHELDGKILLLGVNHDANTTIHLAEVIAEVPYGRQLECNGMLDGTPHRFIYRENDHCCRRFRLADRWLDAAGLQAKGTVGQGPARLSRSGDLVRLVLDRLREDPLVFLHEHAIGCSDCKEARASTAAGLALGLVRAEPL